MIVKYNGEMDLCRLCTPKRNGGKEGRVPGPKQVHTYKVKSKIRANFLEKGKVGSKSEKWRGKGIKMLNICQLLTISPK